MRLVYLLLTLIPGCALAQGAGWKPDRPVELIIGAAPGGANDRIGRALQRGLQDGKFANPVVVMNKPGGGQTIAFSYLASHPGNAHYLALASSSWITTVAGGGTSVTLRDVTPVIKILDEYQVYFVRNDSPIRTAKDIVDRLKKDPGSVSFGFSTATGNPLHISIATFGRLAGVDPAKLTTVVYESGTNTAIQVAGGHLDVGVQSPGSAWQLAQAGKIRLLAVAGPNRLPGELANVPTLREQGINSDANVFYTLFAPKGIDSAQVAWWDRSLLSVMQSEQIRKDAEFNRWTLDPIGHRELPAFLEREHENYRRALAELGLQK